MIETAVEADDAAMEAYLEGEEPSVEMLKACNPQRHQQLAVRPVSCSAVRSKKAKGVQPLSATR